MKLPDNSRISAKTVVVGLYREITKDEVLSLAAQMAYYFLFSMFPLMVFMVALLGFLPVQDLTRELLEKLRTMAPREVYEIVAGHITDVVANERPFLLSASALLALYSASAGVTATIVCLNRAYGVNDGRSFLKTKVIALALTVGVSVLLLLATGLVVGGDGVAGYIEARFGALGVYYAMAWKVIQWLITPAALLISLALLYYFGPDVEQEWKWITPGSVVATALWIVATLGFSFYVTNFGNFNAAYGSLGGVMVTMLWLYLSSLVILIGGELNALLEHVSVEGKNRGERAPGEPAEPPDRPEVSGKPEDSTAAREHRKAVARDNRRIGAHSARLEPPSGSHRGAGDGEPVEETARKLRRALEELNRRTPPSRNDLH